MKSPDQQLPSIQLDVGSTVLDRYRIEDRIAIGGHSVVHRARDERLDRLVCVKVFDKFAADERVWKTAYEHFVQEAFALSRLSHPNTLRIYDFGHVPVESVEGPGVPIQVSEFMNGGNLAQLVRITGPLGSSEAIRTTLTMCEALDEAHSSGIIHRDIKPQNILFGSVGSSRQPKLADFGIANAHSAEGIQNIHRADDTAIVAGFPMVMYSPSWGAPEQLAGSGACARSDLYSLAAVAVFMLTGRVVFRAGNVDDGYERRRRVDELIAEAFVGVDIPSRGISVLQRACAFNPIDRYLDIGSFATELREAFSSEDCEILDEATDEGAPVAEALRLETPAPPARGSSAPPQRLGFSSDAQNVAERTCRFVSAPDGQTVIDVGGQRLRLTITEAAPDRLSLHIKGLSCFLAPTGGRPSSAVCIEGSGEVEMMSAQRNDLGRVHLSIGSPSAGHRLFDLGQEVVAVALGDCPGVVMVDGGSGNECFFIHRAPPPADDSARRWRRSNG